MPWDESVFNYFKWVGLIITCWINWNTLEIVYWKSTLYCEGFRPEQFLHLVNQADCWLALHWLTDWQEGRQAGMTLQVERVVCWSCSAKWTSKGRELGTIACSDYAWRRGLTSVQVLQLTSSTGVKGANFINCIHSWQCDLSRDAPLRLTVRRIFLNLCGRTLGTHVCFGELLSPVSFWLLIVFVCGSVAMLCCWHHIIFLEELHFDL